jgi:hypothetical protein
MLVFELSKVDGTGNFHGSKQLKRQMSDEISQHKVLKFKWLSRGSPGMAPENVGA